jgi:hypothetical protein
MLVKKTRKTPRREIGLARRQSDRLGGRPGYLSDPAEAALPGVPARGGPSAPRTNVIGAATRVRHSLARAIHRIFDENGFFWVDTQIITSSDAEGAGHYSERRP